jgi:predicted amidohydrolase YtcJ
MMRSLLFLMLTSVLATTAATGIRVIQNATIYTLDPDAPWAEALAISDEGIILAVGTSDEITKAYAADAVTTIQMNRRLVLPGFQDAHLHAVEAGINAAICYVEETPMADMPFWFQEPDCFQGGKFADQGWIVGAGVDVSVLLGYVEFPNVEHPISILDKAFPNDPVLILDNIGHGALANTVAMRLVGYDKLTGDPPGGKIVKDPVTGVLTGIVLENAQQKLRDAAFPPTSANMETAYKSLLDALVELTKNGMESSVDNSSSICCCGPTPALSTGGSSSSSSLLSDA